MGTDSGIGLHGTNLDVLPLLEKTGMTSGQVLAATTSSAAHLLGYDGLGVIETGRRAGLVHAEGDTYDLHALAGNFAEVRKDGERVVVRQERHETSCGGPTVVAGQ